MKLKRCTARCLIFLLALVTILGLPIRTQAKTVNEILAQQAEQIGAEDLPGQLPPQAASLAEEAGINADLTGWKELFEPSVFLRLLKSLFLGALGERSGLLRSGGIMILLLCLLRCLSGALDSEVARTAENVLALVGCGVLFSGFFQCVQSVQSGCEQLEGFMGSLIPVFASSMIAGGQTASVAGSGILFALCQAVALLSSFLLPAGNLYFALGVSSGLSGNGQVSALSKFFKKWIVGVVGLILCVFVGGISVQKVFALSSDRLSRRVVKFAAGSFLPIAGNAISDSLDTVFACAETVKTSIGGFGTAGALLILSAPLMQTAAYLLLTGLLSALSEALGGSALSFFFGVTKDMFALLLTLLLCIAVSLCLSLQLLCLG